MSSDIPISPMSTFLSSLMIVLLIVGVHAGSGKILDLNDNLPEYIDQQHDRNWLIKFYAPWCYHCQQLEPTYNNVAERIYHEQGNLIVGRLDCTRFGRICEKYGVDSYPTIIHISKETAVKYRGDRSEASILEFADRLQGPDVHVADHCKKLVDASNKHGLVVLSSISNPKDHLRIQFESLARAHKYSHWFYQFNGTCNDYIQDEGIYLLKRNLKRPLKYPDSKDKEASKSENALVNWLNKESFLIYGQVNYRNIERILVSRKLLFVAVLDEYKPAKRFTASSNSFNKIFEKIASEYAQYEDSLLFGWSSDLELIEYITMSSVTAPNVIALKADYSYSLLVEEVDTTKADGSLANDVLSEKLREYNVRYFITAAKDDKLLFKGGNGYTHVILRHLLGNFSKFMYMYRANPLLVSVIFGFPGLIVIFVLYTTCFDGPDNSSVGSDDERDEEQSQINDKLLGRIHLKQD